MDLQDLWFVLISVLFIGFFFLEGFDYGVGILAPFLGKTEPERKAIISTIGPHWDANEVWMITAGGAMFAAFPHWYATLFSGFYLALVVILLALIGRGVAFKFRNSEVNPRWRQYWDWAIFIGSLVPGLLWGVAFGNLINGTPINANMDFTGNFFDLLNPYSLICGIASLSVFILHGALFLSLKTDGVLRQRAEDLARKLWAPVVVVSLVLAAANYLYIDIFTKVGVNPGIIPIATGAALLSVGYFVRERQYGWSFIMMGLTIVLALVTFFWFMYPNVMVSSTDEAYNLTVSNASSSDYTLEIMTIVAVFFVPVVLIYQGWSYWVFRRRVTVEAPLEY
jgi:cytochrome d ubiquinol oxidase subunit II